MSWRLALVAAWAALTLGPAGAAEPVRVLVLGTYHFANPGLDLHNAKVDDVLQPRRQVEIAAVVDALARFAPNRVAVEMAADGQPRHAVPAYAEYLEGRRAGHRNEIDQIGFRLARQQGLAEVHGIDAPGGFPFEPVQAFARASGRGAAFQQGLDRLAEATREFERLQPAATVGQLLRRVNEPERLLAEQGWYMGLLGLGRGAEQPGVQLVAQWTARNLAICARLAQLVQPGDRVVVVYGSGHAYLLRRCVQETPGWQLVEALDHLPR